MSRSEALGKEPVGKLLWDFSVPAIVGMMVNGLYNIVDSIFVGNYVGEVGLTAVTIAYPIMLVMMAFGMLVGIGAASLVSIRMGERNQAGAEKILGNALAMLIIMAVTFTAIFVLFLDPILLMLGAGGDVLVYAREFTQVILLGSLAMYVGFGLNNVIRSEGNPSIAMYTMLISAVINTILNPIFIMWLGMGIKGSALATVIAQTVSAIWVIAYFMGSKSVLKIRSENLRLDWRIIGQIFKIGISPFLMQIAASVVTLLFNISLINYGGALAVAAYGIVARVAMMILMPIFGITQGAQPIIGYNYGAQNYDRVIEAVKKAVFAGTALSVLGFIAVQILDVYIVRLFNNNPDLISLGSYAIRIVLLMLPLVGFQVVGASYFQAVGKAGMATFLSMSRQVIMLIPLIVILPKFFGLNGVWAAGPTADLISAILTGTFLFAEMKRLKRAAVS
ncbi:MATE family efflux transporter [Dendrosporobacter sp. 1207_IL3150]|uniref:MATE family efflux transporter n=1 Tax=Dendrosporobacter sp. 1207_IL3150 TaxID=3084054 RepID=UPI002FD9FAE2